MMMLAARPHMMSSICGRRFTTPLFGLRADRDELIDSFGKVGTFPHPGTKQLQILIRLHVPRRHFSLLQPASEKATTQTLMI